MIAVDKFNTELANKLIERKGKLDSDRSTFETVWQQLSEFVLPNRGDFIFDRAKGQRLDHRVFDTTAIQANEMLAAALHSGLTNPASKWFDLRPADPALRNNLNIRKWVEEVVRIMLKVFDSSAGNFYQQNHELLLDLVAYGTACIYIEEEVGVGIRFQTRHLSEVFIEENNKGLIDTVYRCFKFTARQATQEWGEENLPDALRQKAQTNPQEKFEFIHVIMPRADAEMIAPEQVSKINKKKEYIGFYVCEDHKAVLDVTGFYEMPYIVVRWEKLIGEMYGRSPGWNALSDIRMINVMSETIIRAAQKQVDPPLLVADDGVIMPMRTHPSGVNVGGVSQDGTPLIQPLQTGSNLNVGLEMMDQRREAIRQAYFVDQFIPKEGTPVTATEAVQNQENRLRLTGPQVGRLTAEYLSRLIDRVFNLLQRAGQLPEAPEELDNVRLDIEYVSPLAKTQRVNELVSLNRAIDSSLSLIEYNPALLDNIDDDSYFRNALEIAGVSASHVRGEDDVGAIRQQRQQAQQAAAQQQALLEGADAAAKLQSSGIDVTS